MKKVIVLLVILAVLAVGAALLLPRYLNPERYRPQIEAAIGKATGWHVSLGEITVQIFGGTSIRIKPVELSDPATGFRTEVGTLRIRTALKPLLRGRLVLHTVEVIRPAITLLWTTQGLQLPTTHHGSQETAPGHPPVATGDGAARVTISKVLIRDGSLKILHQVPGEPSVWALTQVTGVILPAKGKLSLSGRTGQGGASFTMASAGPAKLAVESLGVEDLPPWLVQDLVQPGGILSGTVEIARDGGRITGTLAGRKLAFLDGSRRLKKVEARLSISRTGARWKLDDLHLKAAGAGLRASGLLAPRLKLDLELEPSPVEAALALARSFHPVPLEVKGPGRAQGAAHIRRNHEGAITASASGTLSAATLRLADGLPPIRHATAHFRYTKDGRLTISPASGVFAGGTLEARLGLAALDPPGALSIDVRLQGADLRRLLLGLGVPHARETAGSLVAEAHLHTDLSTGPPGPAGLSGNVITTVTDLTVPGWDLVSTITGQLEQGGSWKDMLHALDGSRKKSATGRRASFDLARIRMAMKGMPWKLSSLKLSSPELTATGSGTFDPVQGAVRVHLDARLSAGLSRKLLQKASFLSSLQDSSGRLVVPVTVHGPVTDPTISVDLESVLSGGTGYRGLLDSLLGGKR